MDGELVSIEKPKQLFEALRLVKKEVKHSDVNADGIELVSCPEHLRPEIEQRIGEIKQEAVKQMIRRDDEEIWLMA
jgi:hypothetical protein